MLFNSFEFLIFLPIVFLLYWFVLRTHRMQNVLIVSASYVFYGWWDWRFLLLIALTSACSYASGLLIERSRHKRQRQWWCGANIVLNLLILGVFKYFNFFAASLVALFDAIGWHLDNVTLDVVLPVGISFYTFQALSYTIDVYRGTLRPTHNVVEFFAFISFFPQLVAGPIERATNLLPQFQRKRRFDYAQAVDGCRQMLWGFLKKLVIADNCAEVVNKWWPEYSSLPTVTLLLLGVLFTLQIYCDFSGYSDIAIGCARLFGIRLTRNFHYPYFSRSIPEFWRRWHISLTTWLRDYLYFPLGGSRCSLYKTVRNVYIVWAVSGLWHGANWTFVCWGLFHATLLTCYRLFGIDTHRRQQQECGMGLWRYTRTVWQVGLTFLLTVAGWILFRADSMGQAVDYFSAMFTNPFYHAADVHGMKWLRFGIVLLFIEWLQRRKEHALQLPERFLFRYRPVRWLTYYAVIYVIAKYVGASQTFVYFQF